MPTFVKMDKCNNCVKIFPQQAIEGRHYADFSHIGGSVVPLQESNSI